jgi:hypothetical protein
MCCWESIVNEIKKQIIRAMHQTAESDQRKWARESILDAVVEEAGNTIVLQVTTQEVRESISIGEMALPIYRAVQIAYPGYQVCAVVKEPLDLSTLTVESRAAEKQPA